MQELFGRLDVAIYDTVHGYRDTATRERGAMALGPKIGIPPGTLSNKANPAMPDHKLGLAESVTLQLVADRFDILHAYAASLRHCAWPLPAHSDASDVELLDAYTKVQEEAGCKARAIREALKDGRVTAEEVATVRARFDNEVRAGLELLSRLEALAR